MWKVFLKLHLAVLIAGFTGVFGRLISYDAFVLVFIRFSIAALSAYVILKAFRKIKAISFRSRLQGLFVGALLSFHLIFSTMFVLHIHHHFPKSLNKFHFLLLFLLLRDYQNF